VDVNVNVVEKPTGNLMAGAGYSSTEGLVLSASISQNNFLGSGNNVALAVNTGKINTLYSFSYTNPYFTVDGISQGFDLYYRKVDSTSTSVTPYKSASYGGAVRFGFPIGEKQALSFGFGVDNTEITAFSTSSPQIIQFVEQSGGSLSNPTASNWTIPVTAAWVSDGKDSFLFPTTGWYQKAALEVAVPGGDLTFYRASYQLQRYFALSKSFTLMLNGEVGYADSYGDTANLPFYKNFYAGGVNTVRGFKAGSLGPQTFNPVDPTQTYAIGGNERVVGQAELLWGVPGLERSVRLGLFFDIGQVYASGDAKGVPLPGLDLGLRYSTGLSFAWISPMGPLKFSYAVPFNEGPFDKIERFQFQLGTNF